MKYELNRIYNEDCLQAMKQMPDKYFDVAIVDPPYGDCGEGFKQDYGRFGNKNGRFEKYASSELGTHYGMNGRGRGKKYIERTGGGYASKYGKKILEWDKAPEQEYFDELFRVSKNQIIWGGGNYFRLPPTRCFIIWRKLTIGEQFTMAMAEYAWASFNDNAKVFEKAPQGKATDPRFHPTQKPIELYKFCLKHFAKKGDKILDTHTGSASSIIACEHMGFDYMGFEIEPYYYEKSIERLERETSQLRLEF